MAWLVIEFMSPELASAISLGEEARYSTSSDLWSLGVIAYLILSGRETKGDWTGTGRGLGVDRDEPEWGVLDLCPYACLHAGRPPFRGMDGSLDSNGLNRQRANLNTVLALV